MKRLLAFFGNRFVLGFIGVLALSLVIWFGLDFIKFGADNSSVSSGVRLLLIALLFGIWLTHMITVLMLQRRANEQVLAGMQQGAAGGDAGVDARSREEQQQLAQRFGEAAALLRKTRFKGASGSRALYQLPWYIIIGPPGAGKTTALVNSGLDFPLADSHGRGGVGGVGGTRNCDWWFTNDAVLIDTAGRYTTQDSNRSVDSGAWLAFLQLLKKYRPRQPVNGVIVAVSVQDLLMQTAEQRAQQARLVRARIDELQEQLGLQLPVYLTFTKCDLVAGFSEFFAGLGSSEREQVWGVTFPAEITASAAADQFGADYDALLQRIGRTALPKVHAERDPAKRALIQGFPLQMGSLKANLADFLKQAFAANAYKGQQPQLRGVYLTSGTQEGTPIDRMMAAVAANFRLGRDVGRTQPGSGKSFFVTRLFRDVIIAEAGLAGVDRRTESRLLWLRRATYIALAAVAVGAIGVWSMALARSQGLMGDVRDATEEFSTARTALPAGGDVSQALPALDPLRRASLVHDQQSYLWLTSLGLYDSSVDSAADELYRNQLLTLFLPRLQRDMEQALAGLRARDEGLIPTLRAYLMLIDPTHRDDATLSAWAQRHWEQTLPGAADKQAALQAHLADTLALQPAALAGNDALIAAARAELRQIPVAQRVYAQLRGGDLGRPVDLYPAIGGDTRAVFGVAPDDARFQMPQLFTVAGYRQLDFGPDSPLLANIAGDRWLFGEAEGEAFGKADLTTIGEEVRRLYLADYNNQWRGLLDSLHIVRFGSLDSAVSTLKQITDAGNSPLLGVLRVTAEQTRLTPPAGNPLDGAPAAPGKLGATVAKADKTMDKLGAAGLLPEGPQPTPVDRAFADLQRLVDDSRGAAPIGEVTTSLRALHDQLATVATAPNPSEAALAAAKARLGGGSDPVRQLTLLASGQPAPVDTWMREAAQNSWSLLVGGAKGRVEGAWQQGPAAACQRTLNGRFPLSRSASGEIAMQDFIDYFKPDGIEAQFVKENLADLLDPQTLKPRSVDGQGVTLAPATLEMLKRGQQIRRAFFAADPGAPSARFTLKPLKLDPTVRRFELVLGDQPPLAYTHGPKIPTSLTWRGGVDQSVRVVFEDLNDGVHRREYQGDWALFRLLGASKLTRLSGNRYQLDIVVDDRAASYELTAAGSDNPFDPALVSSYQCRDKL